MPPSSWSQLARMARPQLERLQDDARARFLREELPLAPRFAELALEARKADPTSLPTTRPEDVAADALSFVLRPTPGAMRTHWPFLRKFALTLSGGRSQGLLNHSYGSVRVDHDRARGIEFEVHSAAHDLDLAAEAGARCLDLLELGRPGARALCALPIDSCPAFWQLALARPRTATRLEFSGGPRQTSAADHLRDLAGCEALIATPGVIAWILDEAIASGVELASLRSLVLVARTVSSALRERMGRMARAAGIEEVRLATLCPLPGARMALVDCPTAPGDGGTGLHVFPDFLWVERIEGQLLLTNVAGHGSALLRFETGLTLAGPLATDPCPACGSQLLRIPANLAIPGTSGLADSLDGASDLLAWRVAADGKLDLAPSRGADGRALEERIQREFGDRSPATRLNDAREMLDWLGSLTEREEQHAAGPRA